MVLLKGNKLQKRLQDLGHKTDGENWDEEIVRLTFKDGKKSTQPIEEFNFDDFTDPGYGGKKIEIIVNKKVVQIWKKVK